MSALPIIAISIGDPNGIGVEIILKAFSNPAHFDHCIPVVFANLAFMEQQQEHFKTTAPLAAQTGNPKQGFLYVVSIWENLPEVSFGEQSPLAGKAAFESLEAAVTAVKTQQADALVTAPINKASIKSNAFPFAGHTHYLAEKWGGTALMILAHKLLRIALATDHIPLKEVSHQLSQPLLKQKLLQLNATLKKDFGCQSPRIAVLGLNPHAGDQGVIGNEDEAILVPVLKELASDGIRVSGPFAADGFFGQKRYANYDGVMSCYHDQGLVGFKTLAFGQGVNVTAGLPFVRTSPDHGTAFDIAGKGQAKEESFIHAIAAAATIWQRRQKTI
jgi:4-hydroxythreonine-4-phosphate dehydrogenase